MQLKTLGYAHNDAQATLDTLIAQGYHLLDIRLKTFSNKAGFSGEDLAARYKSAYHKAPALGNKNYNEPGRDIALKNPETGLQQLARALNRSGIVLLCGCKWVHTCHRFYVAQLAGQQIAGLEVEHLLQAGQKGMIKHDCAISPARCAWVEHGQQCPFEPHNKQTCARCHKPICERHTNELTGFFMDYERFCCPYCYENYLDEQAGY